MGVQYRSSISEALEHGAWPNRRQVGIVISAPSGILLKNTLSSSYCATQVPRRRKREANVFGVYGELAFGAFRAVVGEVPRRLARNIEKSRFAPGAVLAALSGLWRGLGGCYGRPHRSRLVAWTRGGARSAPRVRVGVVACAPLDFGC